MTPILLRRHVHLRRVGDNFIFLDLEKDAYFSLDREKSDRLAALIADPRPRVNRNGCAAAELPESGCDRIAGAPHADAESEALIGELAGSGLIARDPEGGKPIKPAGNSPPEGELFRDGLPDRATAGPGSLFAGLSACASASAVLASRSLAANVARVSRRRVRRDGAVNIAEAQRLVAEFAVTRAFFPRGKSCLFESLALIEFLAGKRLYPRWTFGVRSDPFAAHCWVEADGVVFNDSLEAARAFAPIFSA